MILTLTIQEDAAILSLFFKAAVYFTINIPIWTTLALSGQLPAFRMFDIHVTFVHFKFYLWTFQDYQRQLLSANWLPKLPQFQKLQLETQNQVQKKTVTPKQDNKDASKETPTKGTPKVSKSEDVVEISPSLEKKKSGYKRWSWGTSFKGSPSGRFQSPRSDY